MCGIAGFFDADASFLSNEEQYQILLAKMGRTLKHRGPDASGTLLCNRCGLAHRRLSIIDITGGAQPMSKIYSDYHYHIVYNVIVYTMVKFIIQMIYVTNSPPSGFILKPLQTRRFYCWVSFTLDRLLFRTWMAFLHLPFMMNATKR